MLVQELMQQTIMESLKRREGFSVKGTHQRTPLKSTSLLVHIIVVSVVASQCDERAQAETVGEEDLSRRVQPHLPDNRHASAFWFGWWQRRCEGGLPQSGPAC